ncbi:uncharacterized protein LOC143038061 isoform X2 [Oratosquilla oratoria]|uniref:uncharacterized protein LOC143038061 isoform X2 n=1 Tax=Oratosquilla oratoria TaxID=337810 RepID=UPI003F75C5FE
MSVPTCRTDDDCAKSTSLCRNQQCRCKPPLCLTYSTNGRGYYCDVCGGLGSECNVTLPCQEIGYCHADNFCHCRQGNLYHGICLLYQPVPTSRETLLLLYILVGILAFHKLINGRKTLKKLLYCCRRDQENEEEETSEVGFNPLSRNKSAAYTISNSEFISTVTDPDLELALELSRRAHEGWFNSITDSNAGSYGSISSVRSSSLSGMSSTSTTSTVCAPHSNDGADAHSIEGTLAQNGEPRAEFPTLTNSDRNKPSSSLEVVSLQRAEVDPPSTDMSSNHRSETYSASASSGVINLEEHTWVTPSCDSHNRSHTSLGEDQDFRPRVFHVEVVSGQNEGIATTRL